ncbi:MAG: hypothetical protein IKA03_05170 [Alphaproteobacteria bacterium]|nr:hypothetical protein [Alphaproteobacteria bacterium]
MNKTATATTRKFAYKGIDAGKYVVAQTSLQGVDLKNLKPIISNDSISGGNPGSGTHTPMPDQALKVDEKKEQKDINKMSVSEIEEELNRLNVNEGVLTPEEEARKKALEEALNHSSTPEAGEIEPTQKPFDDRVDDDDKFDIQQGDFIDFLMKEVVLASVAWAGKHTFNAAGYWMLYKPISYGYHAAADGLEELGDWYKAKKEAEKKAQAIRDDIRRQYGEDALVSNDIPSTAPYSEDAKKIFGYHNQELKAANTQLASVQRLREYMVALASGNVDENTGQNNGKKCWQAPDGGLVFLDDPLIQRVTEAFAKVRENVLSNNSLSDEQKRSKIVSLAEEYGTVMLEEYSQRAQASLFAANYATAQQLQALVDGKAPRSREELLKEAKTIFYTAHVAERSGVKGGNSTELLLKTAQTAKKSAATQIQDQVSRYNSSLNELNYLASYNPSTGVYTEDRYFSLLTLPNEGNAKSNHETGLKSIEKLPENADYYILLRAKQISEGDFKNATGISSQEFAEKHERLASIIDQQVERIDVVAPHDPSNKTAREKLIEELKASIKTLSTTEKDAETFALDYCFSQRTSENSKESEAALLARGRLLYYSTRQNDPTQVNGLRQLGQQAAQKAKTSPDTTNASLQLIQQRYAEGTKKSNKAKQSIVDEALSSFETTFEEERKKKEIEIASLISQSASNDNRRNELLARINALKGARKTKENLNPTLYASRVTR